MRLIRPRPRPRRSTSPPGRNGSSLTPMPDEDLQSLIRRRLWELARTGEDAARRARWKLPPETVDRLARSGRSFITEGLAPYLADALKVPENRIRKAAGLP